LYLFITKNFKEVSNFLDLKMPSPEFESGMPL
jgi:hypothetical protein